MDIPVSSNWVTSGTPALLCEVRPVPPLPGVSSTTSRGEFHHFQGFHHFHGLWGTLRAMLSSSQGAGGKRLRSEVEPGKKVGRWVWFLGFFPSGEGALCPLPTPWRFFSSYTVPCLAEKGREGGWLTARANPPQIHL